MGDVDRWRRNDAMRAEFTRTRDDKLLTELAELRIFRDLTVDYWLDELYDRDRLPAAGDSFGWACRDQAITQGWLPITEADIEAAEPAP